MQQSSNEPMVLVKDHKALKHSRHEFTVEVPAVQMGQYFEAAYRKLAPSVEIKGFRPGQAPKVLTIQRIGNERYFQAALDLALPLSYGQAVRQLELHPIAPPTVSVQSYGEGATLVYKAAVDVLPAITLGDYQKLTVKPPKAETAVSATEVDEVIDRLRHRQASTAAVDRPAKVGDRVELDYVAVSKGVKREDLSNQHFPAILGEGVLPKSIERAVTGKKRGETVELDDMVRKEKIHFTVTVHEVQEVSLPELNEAFAKQFGRKDPADLKSAIREQLTLEKEQQARQQLEERVLEVVLKRAQLELPESLIDEELSRRIAQLKEQLGVMWERFLSEGKKDEASIRKELRPQAEHSVKAGLVLGEIARKEGFGSDRGKDEDDAAFQKRVVRRTINFLVASATGVREERSMK